MDKKTIAAWMAFAGGCIVIVQGVGHFPLAYQTAAHQEFAHLSARASDLLILLWLCVGILLLNFGILSLYFSRRLRSGDKAARIFFLTGGITYFARMLFELKYPVSVPAPSHFVLVSIVIACLLFLIPAAITGSDEMTQS